MKDEQRQKLVKHLTSLVNTMELACDAVFTFNKHADAHIDKLDGSPCECEIQGLIEAKNHLDALAHVMATYMDFVDHRVEHVIQHDLVGTRGLADQGHQKVSEDGEALQ